MEEDCLARGWVLTLLHSRQRMLRWALDVAQGWLASPQGWAEANLTNTSQLPLWAWPSEKGFAFCVFTQRLHVLKNRTGCSSLFLLVTQDILRELFRQLAEGLCHFSIILFLMILLFLRPRDEIRTVKNVPDIAGEGGDCRGKKTDL